MLFRSHSRRHLIKKGLLVSSFLLLLGATQFKTPLPLVFNNTNSLVVESVKEDDSGYNISLRNTSTAAVFGLAVAVIGENGVCDLHTLRPVSGSFIFPNGSRELRTLPFPDAEAGGWGSRMGTCSHAAVIGVQSQTLASSVTPRIVIDAVDFEDGTREGDQAVSAMFEAERQGRDIQRQRIAALVEENFKSAAAEDSDWVSSVRTQVSGLSEQATPELVHSLRSRFAPAISSEASIRQNIQSGMAFEKSLFLNQLQLYVVVSSKLRVPIVSLQTWWLATKGQCDFFLPQCIDRTM
jgi:hypothetical protein